MEASSGDSTFSDGEDEYVPESETFDNYENRKIQEESLRNFAAPDFIMEPTIYSTLSRYFQAGGSPEMVVELLSENYAGIAQVRLFRSRICLNIRMIRILEERKSETSECDWLVGKCHSLWRGRKFRLLITFFKSNHIPLLSPDGQFSSRMDPAFGNRHIRSSRNHRTTFEEYHQEKLWFEESRPDFFRCRWAGWENNGLGHIEMGILTSMLCVQCACVETKYLFHSVFPLISCVVCPFGPVYNSRVYFPEHSCTRALERRSYFVHIRFRQSFSTLSLSITHSVQPPSFNYRFFVCLHLCLSVIFIVLFLSPIFLQVNLHRGCKRWSSIRLGARCSTSWPRNFPSVSCLILPSNPFPTPGFREKSLPSPPPANK